MGWSEWRKVADGYTILAATYEPWNKQHLFAAHDGAVYHQGDWADDSWDKFDTPPNGWAWGLSAASWDSSRLDVVTNSNAEPSHRYRQNFPFNEWSPWTSLGGIIGHAPTIDSEKPGQLNMFAIGKDLGMHHRWYVNNQWSWWEPLSGDSFAWGPTSCSWGPGRQDVFCPRSYSYRNSVWHKWYDNGWSGWENLGGSTAIRPAACSWGPGRIDLFISGDDRKIYQKTLEGGHWSDWISLGGIVYEEARGIAACAGKGGPLRIFHTGTDRALYQKQWI
ncbi:hypothetical protein [Streptomyces sp. TLI_146]|uniref:hypothetical protein n=1 Tax=Streptomyces sp. TLI_146 TaxID=1938858 RepID=UPI000CBEF97C|nr:hypothetical protein [Streptomyces sp. TLI_146]PKV84319.1 hypothetical protein BX283_1835 [Streptomyces sp. TLI_146]